MNSNFQKFLLLLWKNWILQKRHKIQLIVEILLPILFASIVVLVRSLVNSELNEFPRIYRPFSISNVNRTVIRNCSQILYSPNNEVVNKLMQDLYEDFFEEFGYEKPMNFSSENELINFYKNNPQHIDDKGNIVDPILGAVIFLNKFPEGGDKFPKNIEYKLRLPTSQRIRTYLEREAGIIPRWNTGFDYPIFQFLGPRDSESNDGGRPGYFREGFIYLQQAVDLTLSNNLASNEEGREQLKNYDINLRRFPFPPYIDDVFIVALQGWLPLIMTLSFIYPVINITKSLVHEKEKRLKESLKIMGLPNWLHWTAWFIKSFAFLLISMIIIVVLLKVPWYRDNNLSVITYSDGTLLFLYLFVFIFNIITFSFLVSTFFSKANSASAAAGVVWFLTYFPYFFLQPRYNELSKSAKLTTSLFCNTGMAFGFQILSMFEGTGSGLQWDTINKGSSPDDNLSILDVILILIADSFIYMLLTLYIEGIRPGEFGVPKPFYFPFTKEYWVGSRVNSKIPKRETISNGKDTSSYFEAEPIDAEVGIRIFNLTKKYDKHIAVNNLNLNLYKNQITGILGHNGAGKSTTFSILSGLFPPTSGTAIVNGYDICTSIQQVRESLGLCPQHDVLFDELTVEEHLEFFCKLKGMSSEKVPEEINQMLKALNLEDKRKAMSLTLSGGMKRKLSVGIALCAGSKVVLLDECTSGMDPGARRSTWDLLKKEKKNRTILLSTHFMEEADYLSDRIAILSNGKLHTSGSSLFLKKKFGGGYHLSIVKDKNCNVSKISNLLSETVEGDAFDVGNELSYHLAEEKSHLFPIMFEELEQRKEELGIASYGASMVTMEEVFIKVGEKADSELEANGNLNNNSNNKVNVKIENDKYEDLDSDERNTGLKLIFQQIWAMAVKKCLYALRNRVLLTFQTLIPVGFLIIALIMIQTLPNYKNQPSLKISLERLEKYGFTKTVLDCKPLFPICDSYSKYADKLSNVENISALENTSFVEYILQESSKDIAGFNYRYIIGMEATERNNESEYSVFEDSYEIEEINSQEIQSDLKTIRLVGFFNNQPYHGPPLTLNFISNAILRQVTNDDEYTLNVINHPLPYTSYDDLENLDNRETTSFQVGFNVSFGMSFLAASFVVFLIRERENRAKHLQFVSGVKFSIFWLSNFLFDFINYIIPCMLLIIVLIAFQAEDVSSAIVLGHIFIVFILYGWAIIPLMYFFSFFFSIPSTGFTRMTMFNVFTGIASLIAVSVLKNPELELLHIADALDWILKIFPNYDLGMGIVLVANNAKLKQLCPRLFKGLLELPIPISSTFFCLTSEDNVCCSQYPKSYLDWQSAGVGSYLLFLFIIGVVSIIIILFYEAKIFEKIKYMSAAKSTAAVSPLNTSNDVIDSDVLDENERIRNTDLSNLFQTDNLILRDLTRSYDGFVAVDKLNLGVKKGETFGLLGINGAGKTTTFKMLTGDLSVTSGDAFVYGKSIKSEIKLVQQNLGYTPQYDAIIDELTGRETIRLFARIRGLNERVIDTLIDELAEALILTKHINKYVGNYSGGNKRKLSTAISLVGNPKIVFLDECSTGVDPVAKRHLWSAISKVSQSGTGIVITSHSMEECEALCSRLAIMVNGKFKCIGSPQHLKNKFGNGYILMAQMSQTSMDENWMKELNPIRNFIESSFKETTLKDCHRGFVQYEINDKSITWGKMFSLMETAKKMFNLDAYSIGQTTLEQIFLNFTKTQLNNE